MISKIKMKDVASFKSETSLETDKKVNLIYGLNGTGKSTISDFLYSRSDDKFRDCAISPEQNTSIVVYNQSFVRDFFYESESIKGIFSLSKENREAKTKFDNARGECKILQDTLEKNKLELLNTTQNYERKTLSYQDNTWKIKGEYYGGDRPLDFCLKNVIGSKKRLFEHLIEIEKPRSEPEITIPELENNAKKLNESSGVSYSRLPTLTLNLDSFESHPLLKKVIVGNAASSVAGFIEKLQNSDWVNQGLKYLPDAIDPNGSQCPFCQENTITPALVKTITEYFDAEYKRDLEELEKLATSDRQALESLEQDTIYKDHKFGADDIDTALKLYSEFKQIAEGNHRKIEDKLKTPSQIISLVTSNEAKNAFNKKIQEINVRIDQYNEKIRNKNASLTSIKEQFWLVMRWKYDAVLDQYLRDKDDFESEKSAALAKKEEIESNIKSQQAIIAQAQKDTVNIDEAVEKINAGLLDIGIEDFKIKKHSDSLYKLIRHGQDDAEFSSLSEGEKMLISFLYFCELSHGRLAPDDASVDRIAVIDDPISSLSHVYIFNVGCLIKERFINSTFFSQVFILTHSLYFFYELAELKNKDTINRFRLTKNSGGSRIQAMKFDEIQNDYQAYWSVINDPEQPSALLANCMRCIVDYFFGFVEKCEFYNVFQKPALQQPKFQAFNRYMNRESHADGRNIMDLKEFDYDTFREGFSLVFKEAGYEAHYEKMSRLK